MRIASNKVEIGKKIIQKYEKMKSELQDINLDIKIIKSKLWDILRNDPSKSSEKQASI